ncbi:MAG TPA: DUF1189 family protein [Elusimicrobiota bacterium]|nr:DUF1189 family protein [Elusimicrobiota bacterium]
MILLDPVNAITSVSFYRKIAKQAFSRTLLYLSYLALIFCVLGAAALKIRVGPALDQTFAWLAKSAPVLTFGNGKFSSPSPMPVVLRDPADTDIAVGVDTTRTAPITEKDMDDAGVTAYLTQSDFYLRRPNGTIEDRSFSDTKTDKPVTLDAAFYQQASALLNRILYPAAILGLFIVFLVWKLAASLFYSVVAMALSNLLHSGRPYAELFNLSAYAQTLIIAVQIIFLFMPSRIPLFSLLALLVTGSYLYLALRPEHPQDAAAA